MFDQSHAGNVNNQPAEDRDFDGSEDDISRGEALAMSGLEDPTKLRDKMSMSKHIQPHKPLAQSNRSGAKQSTNQK